MSISVDKIVEPVHFPKVHLLNNIIMLCLGLSILGIPLAIGYAMLMKHLIFKKSNEIQKQFLIDGEATFREYIGQEVEHLNVAVDISTRKMELSGIAYRDGFIYLMSLGLATKVPIEMVRDYTWRIAGVTKHTIVGAGLLYGSSAKERLLDEQSELQAYVDSGFTVSIKDITYPTWHIMNNSQPLCNKWSELLQQQLDANER